MPVDLAALLKDVPKLDTGREQIEYIRLDLIDEDPHNFYQLTGIEELAANIELCGLQQPIRVRPIPDTDRYMIVSGHRRRAALELLAKDDPGRWNEAPCIVSRDIVSPTLQQLQLIFANSNTRKMSDAEISEQAVQVEKLLYQLKEEEGYEFPGRMRDHVAEVVGTSKSKLARLKVIREKLAKCWSTPWKKGKLNESVAYELAQMPETWQQTIFNARGEKGYLDAKYIKTFRDRFKKIADLECKTIEGRTFCQNASQKQHFIASNSPYCSFYCDKCCKKCPDLASCKYVCPTLATKAAQLRADKRAARKQEIAAEREAERPKIEKVESIWHRFGAERNLRGFSVKDCKEAMGAYYWSDEQTKFEKLENGTTKISSGTKLPYGIYLHDVSNLIALADLFGCSLDYMLCRTDVKEMATEAVSEQGTKETEREFIPGTWYPATVEPPVGVPLVLIDAEGYTDDGKYIGCGEFKTYCLDAPVILWTVKPSEKDAAEAAPAPTGWRSGTPAAYGTYAAYVKVTGAASAMLRELLWDGEEWFLFGAKIDENVTVQCWTERPDFSME